MKQHLWLMTSGMGFAFGIWLLAASISQSAADGDDVKSAIAGLAIRTGNATPYKNRLFTGVPSDSRAL